MAWGVSSGALIDVEISALGVIERAHFSPGPGLTVITGETGAGKTMILSALSLLTGARADATVVRTGSERAHIVGRFAVDAHIAERVSELGGEVESGEVLLSRTVTSEGKSRANVGGSSTTISTLSDIGAELLSIHGQSANFTLLKADRAREILDRYGAKPIADHSQRYRALFLRYREVVESIKSLEELRSTRERELERITTFLTDFDRVKPLANESALLKERILALENVDATRSALASALNILADDESSISGQLALVKRALDAINDGTTVTQANQGLIREISILVNELSSSLRRQEEDLDVEPGAIEEMHSRRAEVVALIKRYGQSGLDDPEGALIDEAKRSRLLFGQLQEGDQGIAALESERQECAKKLLDSAKELSRVRQEYAQKCEEEISVELSQLAMPAARISILVEDISEGLAVNDGARTRLCSPLGCDEVTFLLTPHLGAQPLPINKGASGGELSRIMLAIEVVLAGRSTIPTYIFDEVDAGVGGKAAVEVGRRLARLAQHAQVLVVTHLPQVAAWADTHYSIRKESSESVTSSDLTLLEGSDRTNELARMMAGREESPLAREHAEELLAFVAAEQKRMAGTGRVGGVGGRSKRA